MGQVTDTILNHSNVRIFNGLTHELTRIKPYLTQHAHAYRHTVMYGLFLRAVQGVMIGLLLTACGVLLMHLYAQKKVTVGDFALIIGVTLETAFIIWYTMYEWEECTKVIGRMAQGLTVLLSENPVHIPTRTITAPTLGDIKGHVQFNDVTFGYDKNTPVLTDFSLDIKPGSKVGFVGYSGGGKTTLFNLLLGLYPVTKGSITIDGISMNDIDTHTLRNAIGLIPQDTLLFDRTIQDNIRYARLDATDAEVIQAAQQACVHDFVTHLPDGYDTTVGERGTKLSGGQKQRIAIARAFLKNAPILMMDEATSQLDAETELMIQKSMDMLMRGKTTFVIAHRLSTIFAMDRILVLDKGTIVQDGTHADLIQQDGVYRTLWNSQTDGFLGMSRQAT
jgi:ATP-binding cassette subfamily B protein